MATSIFKGAAGRLLIVRESRLEKGCTLLCIESKDGSQSMEIQLTAHITNMVAGMLEFEADNGYAMELMAENMKVAAHG